MIKEKEDVTVVLPVKNGGAFIAEQLTALCGQQTDVVWGLLVVDNGSSDDTLGIVKSFQEKFSVPVRILDASDARGLSEVRNAGVGASEADKILMCDADDVVDRLWVDRLGSALDDFHIVAGSIDHELLNDGALRYRGRGHAARRPPVNQGFLPFAPGANFGFRRSLFERLLGFDRTIGAAEDVDFSWRAQIAGYELGFEPNAIVHYRFHSNASAVFRQAFGYGRADARLQRKFSALGVAKRGVSRSVRQWFWLFRNVGSVRSAGDKKLGWLRELGYNAGRMRATFELEAFRQRKRANAMIKHH